MSTATSIGSNLIQFEVCRSKADGTPMDDAPYLLFKSLVINSSPQIDMSSDVVYISVYTGEFYTVDEANQESRYYDLVYKTGEYADSIGESYTEDIPQLIPDSILNKNKSYKIVVQVGANGEENPSISSYAILKNEYVNIHFSPYSNGSVAIGGFSTAQEMDNKFESYNPTYFYNGIEYIKNTKKSTAASGIITHTYKIPGGLPANGMTRCKFYYPMPYATGDIPTVVANTSFYNGNQNIVGNVYCNVDYTKTNNKYCSIGVYNTTNNAVENVYISYMAVGERDRNIQNYDASTGVYCFPKHPLKSNNDYRCSVIDISEEESETDNIVNYSSTYSNNSNSNHDDPIIIIVDSEYNDEIYYDEDGKINALKTTDGHEIYVKYDTYKLFDDSLFTSYYIESGHYIQIKLDNDYTNFDIVFSFKNAVLTSHNHAIKIMGMSINYNNPWTEIGTLTDLRGTLDGSTVEFIQDTDGETESDAYRYLRIGVPDGNQGIELTGIFIEGKQYS